MGAGRGKGSPTVQILTFCRILIFVVGILTFIYANLISNFCDSTQNREKIIFFCDFFADVIFAKGMQLKSNIVLRFFGGLKQHLVPEMNYFRK